MSLEKQSSTRPVIFDYRAIPDYLRAMAEWRRENDPGFSIRRASSSLRRCSPSLVTRVLKGERRLTVDRVDDFGRLLQLTPAERTFLSRWVANREVVAAKRKDASPVIPAASPKRRKEGQNDLLRDWLNVYVREACRLRGFLPTAVRLHRLLGGMASLSRIDRSLKFLFREGYLRRTLDGIAVNQDPVVTTTDGQANLRIRKFHQNALRLAERGLSLYPIEKRHASALILPLNESSIVELKELLQDFYERLIVFSEDHLNDDETLYQVIVNLTPVGGQSNDV